MEIIQFPTCALDLFTNDVIFAFDDALRWNKCRMDIEIELTKGIFFLEVVFPSTKAHFDLNSPLIGREKKLNFLRFFIGSSAAPWHADSKNVYMSVANITASWSKKAFSS